MKLSKWLAISQISWPKKRKEKKRNEKKRKEKKRKEKKRKEKKEKKEETTYAATKVLEDKS